MGRDAGTHRRELLKAGAALAGIGALAPRRLWAQDADEPTFGPRDLVRGLDGMSRVTEAGLDPFFDGHAAAAVLAASFFCRDRALPAAARRSIRAIVDARLLDRPMFAAREGEDEAEPVPADELVAALDAGVDLLRRSGHNVIFAALALRALRELPEAATPARVAGLCATVRSFGSSRPPGGGDAADAGFADLDDEARFVRLAFTEYLHALELYEGGKGHHGFAGHLLTFADALLELKRLGHGETAQKGVAAYAAFVREARRGADLGGRPVQRPKPAGADLFDPDYWAGQERREATGIVTSHVLKYPFALYALLPRLDDEELRERVLASALALTAVS